MLLATHHSSRALLALVSLVAADAAIAQNLNDPSLKSEVLRIIRSYYFREVPLDTTLPVDELVASLDPHSEYVPKAEADARIRELSAQPPVGYGLEVRRVGRRYVVDFVDPYDCAGRAGLLAGDELRSLAGTSIHSFSDSQLYNFLHDPGQWAFEVQVYRRSIDDTLRFWVSRNFATPFTQLAYFGMIDDTTGYIKFYEFPLGISNQVRAALDTLRERGMTSCMLDLRYNHGGIVSEAMAIEDIFVSGHVRMMRTRSIHENMQDSILAEEPSPYESMPLTVLVNHDSWSAAELLAGSLQDLDRATIVGEATGGKALVMRYFSLSNGDRVLLTIAGAILPSGRCTQAIYHEGAYDFAPPALPSGINDHTADALYTQMPCRYFTTAHGRPVSWHEGIIPDIVIGEVQDSPPNWYIPLLDSVAVLRIRDSIVQYREMGFDRFVSTSHFTTTTLTQLQKKFESLDTTPTKHEAYAWEDAIERDLCWRVAFRIWDADATLRCLSRRLPISRRAWIEPRPRSLTGAAR